MSVPWFQIGFIILHFLPIKTFDFNTKSLLHNMLLFHKETNHFLSISEWQKPGLRILFRRKFYLSNKIHFVHMYKCVLKQITLIKWINAWFLEISYRTIFRFVNILSNRRQVELQIVEIYTNNIIFNSFFFICNTWSQMLNISCFSNLSKKYIIIDLLAICLQFKIKKDIAMTNLADASRW